MTTSPRPTILFDGACGFCRRWIDAAKERTGNRVDYLPYQEHLDAFPELEPAELERAVHLVLPDGGVRRGAAAVFTALTFSPRGGNLLAALYRGLPGFAPLSEAVYRWVAGHRGAASKAARWQDRAADRAAEHRRVALWFARGLGLVYVTAFLSLFVQIPGLYGAEGILPMERYMAQVRNHFGGVHLWQFPSLFWWVTSAGGLQALAGVGALAGLWGMAGRAVRPALLVAWLSYLSFTVGGGLFLSFQWDHLLVETGFAALLLYYGWGGRRAAVSLAGIWALRIVLFRLILSSGLVKLFADGPTWEGLTALSYHFETQPLPNGVSWYAHHLPDWMLKAGTAATLALELGTPWLIFCGRRARAVAAGLIVFLMAMIAATGNYGFFNLLTVVLAIALLDDRQWAALVRRTRELPRVLTPPPVLPLRGLGRSAVVAFLVLASASPMIGALRTSPPTWARVPHNLVAPFRIVNGYGLFARMTTERPELIIEATADGSNWLPYRFRYKPGDPGRRPGLTGPHMPRLDWQLWFAALGSPERNTWVYQLARQLCAGSPAVLDLFAEPALRDLDPMAVRVRRFDYRFSTPEERAERGRWWVRSEPHRYGPVVPCR